MAALNIYAGSTAMQRIKKDGFEADMFGGFLGASGGPKWFVLAGLDKVIFKDFLDNRHSDIDIMGSSAGAFRAACFAQKDSAAAIDRLAKNYANTVYSEKPTASEITRKGYDLLHIMLGDKGVSEILSAERKNAHFFVQHCHGLVASPNKLAQMTGLSLAAAKNAISRKGIAKHFSRAVFSAKCKTNLFNDPYQFPTDYYQMTEQNLVPSLMASGSIPVVLEGIANIPGAKAGMYRDGGIIDYHFDLSFESSSLVLYPHFYAQPVPGWFDKGVKRRACHSSSYDNVVIFVPSDEFVASLPYAKIPDRKDFETMPAEQRKKYWMTVIQESDKLADEFLSMLHKQNIEQALLPLQLQRI